MLSTKPFEVVGFDIVGPLPEDKDGNKYLLTAVDHFTRYPLAIPITNREHATVVHALHRHLICVFGPPKAFLSDCEKSFVSKVTTGLFELMNIQKKNTSPYRPSTNASCERFHRYMNASLTMFVNQQKTDWSDYIDSILYAYRTSFCSATGYTPFELLFGRKATMPPDIIYDLAQDQIYNENKRGINVSKSMRTAYRFARRRQLRAATINKQRRDKNRLQTLFKPGDMVWKFDRTHDTQGPAKLQYRFSGPHIIQGPYKQRPNLYTITDYHTNKTTVCNVDLLIPARHDCSDLGDPLGWPSTPPTNTPTSTCPDKSRHNAQHDSTDTHATSPTYGDMVALRVEPDDVENIPFSVGEIHNIDGDHITVQWYGNTYGNIRGAWRRGFFQPSDSRRYYRDKKLHRDHKPYTSETSETKLSIEQHVIGKPFQLNRRNALPHHVLLSVSKDKHINWTLPASENDMLEIVAAQ